MNDELTNGLKGKVIDFIETSGKHYRNPSPRLCVSMLIYFTDGSVLDIDCKDGCVDALLIEPTLTNDVIPIGANSLREGSV